MADDPDPPRRCYEFKPRAFERANEPPAAPAASEASSVPANADRDQARSAGRVELKDLIRDANVPGPVLRPSPPVPAANEVTNMLRDNLARENAAGLNELAYRPPKKSRRCRDYYLVLVPMDAALGILAYHAYLSRNVVLFVYCIGGIGVLTAGLTWVMWFIMDDY